MNKNADIKLHKIGFSVGVCHTGMLMPVFSLAAVWEKSAHFCPHSRTPCDIR